MTDRLPGFHTLAIHAERPRTPPPARATPIYQTTSFVFDDVDHAASLFGLQAFGNIYSRIGNPTCAVLEERVAALEGGTAGVACASGHAAQVIVMHALMQPGDEFVAARRSAAARSTSSRIRSRISAGTWWADSDDPRPSRPRSRRAPRRSSSSRSNPGGVIVDLEAIGQIAAPQHPVHRRQHDGNAGLIRPFEYGADIIVHSATVSGRPRQSHRRRDRRRRPVQLDGRRPPSDAVEAAPEYGGMVLGEPSAISASRSPPRARPARSRPGAVALQRLPDPHRHRDPALAHAAPFRQRAGGGGASRRPQGGVVGELSGLPTATTTSPRYCPRAPGRCSPSASAGPRRRRAPGLQSQAVLAPANIGDTRSLVIHPASTTHRQLTDEQRARAGAGQEVVQLSIGSRILEDLIADSTRPSPPRHDDPLGRAGQRRLARPSAS